MIARCRLLHILRLRPARALEIVLRVLRAGVP